MTKKQRTYKGSNLMRNFYCTICGKSYLSYPALYTHNKMKHKYLIKKHTLNAQTQTSFVEDDNHDRVSKIQIIFFLLTKRIIEFPQLLPLLL